MQVAKRLKDVDESATELIVSPEACKEAFDSLSDTERAALVSIHGRIQAFAQMQRKSVVDMEMDIPGGKAGHTVSPCKGVSWH
jgi:histidinol dehydrogenase